MVGSATQRKLNHLNGNATEFDKEVDMATMPPKDIQEKVRRSDILLPIDPEATSRWRPAPRLESLYGKVGGFLGNRKDNAGPLLLEVKELLDKRFELQDSTVMDKFIYSKPASKGVIDILAGRCDFVVTAIAD
jgi:hypothetical protein